MLARRSRHEQPLLRVLKKTVLSGSIGASLAVVVLESNHRKGMATDLASIIEDHHVITTTMVIRHG